MRLEEAKLLSKKGKVERVGRKHGRDDASILRVRKVLAKKQHATLTETKRLRKAKYCESNPPS